MKLNLLPRNIPDLDKVLSDLNFIVDSFIRSNIKIPKKKVPCGSDWFNDYVHGWNDCVDEIKRLNGR